MYINFKYTQKMYLCQPKKEMANGLVITAFLVFF